MPSIDINSNTPRQQFTLTASQTVINVNFIIYAAQDAVVILDGTTLDPADYTVTNLANENGATITLDTPATGGEVATVFRRTVIERSSQYQQDGRFDAAPLERDLDVVTTILQENKRDIDRKVGLAESSIVNPSNVVLPDPSDGAGIVWDGTDGSLRNTTSSLAVLEGNAATVASNITNINTVAGISANVTTVAGISSNVTTVAGISANVTTVAGISSNVTTVAGIDTDVTTVAGIDTDVTTVSSISANVTTVAGVSANVTTVAGIETDVTTVAGISADVTTVAGIETDVTTVAASFADVTTVADDITNVNTVASNISGVNSFADRYRISSSDPVSSLDEGDLVFNTTDNRLKFYDGASWNNIEPGILASDNVTWTGDHIFQGVLDVTNVNAEGSAGGKLRNSGGTDCASWGAGGGQNFSITNTLSFGAGGATVTGVLDEDNMASDSATKLATQQSIKAYVDNATPAASETVAGLVERASDAEAAAGTDTTRYITPKQLADNSASAQVTDGTGVAITSGTEIQFTGIDSNTRVLNFDCVGLVQTGGAAAFTLEVGTTGGYGSTGYDGVSYNQSATTQEWGSNIGFPLSVDSGANSSVLVTMRKVNGNKWALEAFLSEDAATNTAAAAAGRVSLAGDLDRIKLTSTQTFTAGDANIKEWTV